MKDWHGVFVGVLVILTFTFVGVSLMRAGYVWGREVMQDEAVEHGAAEYDSVTGEWKWKN
jgi:uncharacterized membrane protein YkvI